jgi:RNA polymerase sigma-70 factor, ECF subfamily
MPDRTAQLVDHLFRDKAGQMVASLTRVVGASRLDLAEEAVQESLVAALRSWPFEGIPENPGGWLFRTAKNRVIDRIRHEAMAGEKAAAVVREITVLPDDEDEPRFALEIRDDRLAMMLMCCHPSLSRDARVALTPKTVGGFGIDEIARAFLSRRETIQQRLVRAKKQLREGGATFRMPDPSHLAPRVDAVLEVLYLMFNEGYHATEGDAEIRPGLCAEAIRLATLVAEHPLAGSPKARALLALMQLHASRLPARATAGELSLLEHQDRTLWDRRLVAAGLRNLDGSATGDEITAWHVEAAIAACHAVARTWDETDWTRVVALYDDLLALKPTPVVRINRAIALAKLEGPEAGLAELDAITADDALAAYLPLHAARGDLRAATGDLQGAAESFRRAASLSRSTIVRRYFEERGAECGARGAGFGVRDSGYRR